MPADVFPRRMSAEKHQSVSPVLGTFIMKSEFQSGFALFFVEFCHRLYSPDFTEVFCSVFILVLLWTVKPNIVVNEFFPVKITGCTGSRIRFSCVFCCPHLGCSGRNVRTRGSERKDDGHSQYVSANRTESSGYLCIAAGTVERNCECGTHHWFCIIGWRCILNGFRNRCVGFGLTAGVGH